MSQEFELYFEMVDEADCGREFKVFRNSSGEIVHEEVHCDEDFGLAVTSCVYINGEHLTGDGWRLLEGTIGLDKVFEAYEQGVDIFAFMTDFDEQADSDEDGLRLWSESLRRNQERLSSESAREIEAGFFENSAEMNTRPRTGGVALSVKEKLFLYCIVCGAVEEAIEMLHSGSVSPNAKMREFVVPDWVDLKDSARVAQDLLARPGDSALHLAVAHGRVELVRLLVEAGADVYATNKGGQTPLEVACEKGAVSAVHALLDALPAADARALVLYQEVGQKDALSVAIRYDSDEVVRLLIGYDADGLGGRFYSLQRLQDEVLRAVYSRSAGSFVELANATGFDPTSKVDGESLLSHFSGVGKEVVKEYQTNYRFMKRVRDVNTRLGAVFDGGVAVDEGDAPVNRRRGPSL